MENTGTTALINVNNQNATKNHVFMNQRVGNRSMPINKAVLNTTGNNSTNQSTEIIPNPNNNSQYARINLNT